jgi:hypothetical protein
LFFVVLEEKEAEVVELTLHTFMGDIWQPIPWERAPEFRNKITLFGPGKCIVTEEHAISGLADLRANHIYFLRTYNHDEKNEYWIYQHGIGIVPAINTTPAIRIKQVRGDWIWSTGTWLLPNYP